MSFLLLLHSLPSCSRSQRWCHNFPSHSHCNPRQFLLHPHESTEDAFARAPNEFLLATFNGHFSFLTLHSFLGSFNSVDQICLISCWLMCYLALMGFLPLLWLFLLRLLDHSLNIGILQAYTLGSHFCILILCDITLRF